MTDPNHVCPDCGGRGHIGDDCGRTLASPPRCAKCRQNGQGVCSCTEPSTLPPVTLSDEDARRIKRITRRRELADEEWRQAIREAVEDGATLREVAEVAGISHTAVKFIARGR